MKKRLARPQFHFQSILNVNYKKCSVRIVPRSKLRDLIAKGPKYREPCKVDWDKKLSILCEAVDQYALQWTKREMVELSVLSSWKEMVKGQIEEISNNPLARCWLQNTDVKACLSDLHSKYGFVPANKAPNNIIIIRKRYYIETLINPSCTKPFGTHTIYQGGWLDPPAISKTIVPMNMTFFKVLQPSLNVLKFFT